ncbi:hypothetical protein TELCIR_03156 [Teladorsagia circumcincta]|uniref:Uncharacterized protein n=1 Tax=Teladorsagia circumcincta TaxID=45464 RepID=A0A2G9UZ98_TELCI|nr:hypothetical protein TELCIR_03156 [Teladorsagia circumcincta]
MLSVQHVTFASPAVLTESQKKRESKADPRKRQTHQHSSKQKKAKHAEQFALLQQCEEVLVEVEHDCKVIEEKTAASRHTTTATLNEMGDLVCKYAEQDNQLVSLEEDIVAAENSILQETCKASELEQEVNELVQHIKKHEEFDNFLSDLADNMNDPQSDPIAQFYEALPNLERMLAGLSV